MEETIKETSENKTLEEDLMEILNTFTTQEMGNKVTQFNMQGLASVLLMSLKKER